MSHVLSGKNTMPDAELHVVIGGSSGIGSAVVQTLAEQGKRVRSVSRHGKSTAPQQVEFVAADAMNEQDMLAACQGASVVYYCANAPYYQWSQYLSAMLENVIKATTAAQAKLVIADNLYMYPPTTQPITENTPIEPHTRKGAIRAKLSERLMNVHKSGQLPIVIGRAPDYYGPNALNSYAGESTLKALFAGKPLPWFMSLDMPHSFSYVQDFSRGLVTLGEHADAYGQVWFIPSAPALTGRAFLTLLHQTYYAEIRPNEKQSNPKFQLITGWMIRLAGITNPVIREIYEMRYEFDRPYLVDASKYTRKFGFTTTPHQMGMAETVRWYQQAIVQNSNHS